MKQFYSYCLQGNINKAYEYLQKKGNDTDFEKLKNEYYNRFYAKKPVFTYKTNDEWIKKIINGYYEYFVSVLTNKVSIEIAENFLVEYLIDLLPDNETLIDLDSIEERLGKEFKMRGFYFLGGVTPPFRGPYIWSKEEKVEYNVVLPEGSKKITVYFMSDFILQSWLHFATFGEKSTGGWAKKNALYCVKERYEKLLDKPDFLYSYLTHEAQHFSDYEKFPNLISRDLEYRAKLVELVYHPLNNKVLIEKFLLEADNKNKDNPHPYSSYVICTQLSKYFFDLDYVDSIEKWSDIESYELSNYAKELFQKHTELLIDSGKDIVESVI